MTNVAALRSVTVLQWIALASLLAWLYLAIGHGFFWRTDQRLPARQAPPVWPSVAIVIPARDEADVLPVTLPTLLTQDYPGPVQLILVDDGSTDGTTEVARSLAEQAARRGGSNVTAAVTASTPPPPGWTGKLWALRRGVECAGDVEFLLLTDADIAHDPGSLTSLVAAACSQRLDMVSQMAVLRAETFWERLIVPAFVYFFAMLYPFRWSNRQRSKVAAAAGGCSLVRREALAAGGGLAAIRGAVIDDVAVARIIKKAGGRTWLGLAEQVHSRRPYPKLADLWNMVARTAYTQLRHSPLLLLGTVLGLGLVFVVPPLAAIVGLATGDLRAGLLGTLTWLIMTATYLPMIRYYRQPLVSTLLLPGVATLYLAMTVDSARRTRAGRGASWKGRTYDEFGHPTTEPAADGVSATGGTVAPAGGAAASDQPSAPPQAGSTASARAGASPTSTAAGVPAGIVIDPPRDPWNDALAHPRGPAETTNAPDVPAPSRPVDQDGSATAGARPPTPPVTGSQHDRQQGQ